MALASPRRRDQRVEDRAKNGANSRNDDKDPYLPRATRSGSLHRMQLHRRGWRSAAQAAHVNHKPPNVEGRVVPYETAFSRRHRTATACARIWVLIRCMRIERQARPQGNKLGPGIERPGLRGRRHVQSPPVERRRRLRVSEPTANREAGAWKTGVEIRAAAAEIHTEARYADRHATHARFAQIEAKTRKDPERLTIAKSLHLSSNRGATIRASRTRGGWVSEPTLTSSSEMTSRSPSVCFEAVIPSVTAGT
jgi:hypothetical protein